MSAICLQNLCSCCILTTATQICGVSSTGSCQPRQLNMQQHNRPAAVWVLLFILHAALLTSSQAQRQQQDAACPFDYKRHSLDSFQDAAIRPYLFGGIYNSDRTCVNCQRGGLWSDFCGFKVSGKMKDIPFWSLQLCNGSTIDAIIKRTMQMDNAGRLACRTADNVLRHGHFTCNHLLSKEMVVRCGNAAQKQQ